MTCPSAPLGGGDTVCTVWSVRASAASPALAGLTWRVPPVSDGVGGGQNPGLFLEELGARADMAFVLGLGV